MRAKSMQLVAGAVVFAAILAALAWQQHAAQPAVPARSAGSPPTGEDSVASTSATSLPPGGESVVPTVSPPAAPALAKVSPPKAKPQTKPVPPPKDPIQDPLAREALGDVGEDPAADEEWILAINNPDLPPDERKDLIEDLNEDGFDNPDQLTREDLPKIINRLELIEELAPDALDAVNEAAFQEAHKDLVNMLAKTL